MLYRARCDGWTVCVHQDLREAWYVPSRSECDVILILSAIAVTLAASALFLLFGVVYLYEALLDPESSDFHPVPVS